MADSDGDGNAEIVIVENGKAGYDHVPLQLWGDAQNRWVPTRRIWNQHTYHITNITELGLLPPGGEQPNWLIYNNYRQNLPDFDPFLAPDLAAEMLAPSTGSCPEALELRAKVCNLGQLWAPPGVSVFFLDGASEQALTCDEPSVTPVTLEPGQCVVTSCTVPWVGSQGESKVVRVCVDAFDFACTGPGIYNECNEENNGSDMTVSGCMP